MAFIKIHRQEDFLSMMAAGNLATQTLNYISSFIKEGVSTLELNDLCHKFIIDNNAIPAPLNYKKFPKSICTSINNIECHGIPNNREILKNGDIISVDVTVILNGWHGDKCITFAVGEIGEQKKQLVDAAYGAMWSGIKVVKNGSFIGDIGEAVETYTRKNNFWVDKMFVGHGIGKIFHTEPYVPFYGTRKTGEMLKTGMFLTVEPIITETNNRSFICSTDKWTAYTGDGSWAAQFEHTLGVYEKGCMVFTLTQTEKDMYPQFDPANYF